MIASGCAGYTGALGYRSRQAVLKGDISAFDGLMEEAAGTTPKNLLDNPTKTVLSHFLDFGGSDRFFPMIDAWMKKGWVSEMMTCAIHRARYRGVKDRDPTEAKRAAGVCLDRARAAADNPDRRWEIEACLDEAPFLTETSTEAIAPYVAIAADPTEPFLFREGLLAGLTKVFLQDPAIRRTNDPTITSTAAIRASTAQLDAAESRFRFILSGVRVDTDAPLIRGATAFAALEIERASLALGRSFLATFTSSASQDLFDLAFGWVRAMKAKERVLRLDSLGLWDRKREPALDTYWYGCARREGDAIEIAAKAPEPDRERLRTERCKELESEGRPPLVVGPYPLELTARAVLTSSVAGSRGDPRKKARLTVKRRIDP